MTFRNRWWTRSLAFTVALSPALGLAEMAAEPVSLRPRWKPEEERRYDISAVYKQTAQHEQGNNGERSVTQSARLLLHVTEVDASGGATVRITFESLHAAMTEPGGGTGEVFDWKPSVEAAPAAAPAAPEEGRPQGAEPPPLQRLLGALTGCTMTVSIAPDGSIGTIAGLVPLAQALQDQGGDNAAMQGMGFFSPVRLKNNLSLLWRVDPERRPREPGASWKTTEHLTLGEGHEADATTTWALAGVDDLVASITGTIAISPSPTERESDPAAPRLTIMEQTGTSSIRWDTALGAPIEVIDDRSATWAATVDLGPGAPTPQVAAESRASGRIEIKLVR